MEAATLQKKKNAINKAKLKKTIKNVLCRPDPVLWPAVSDEQGKHLDSILSKHRIVIPEFKKPHWNELKKIPKGNRPKPPQIEKVDGLLFGISECNTAVDSGDCAAVIIESDVNPRIIVQPVLEACVKNRVPVVCISDLRMITTNYFGIPTSCLGVKKDYLQDISSKVLELAKDTLPLDEVIETKVKITEVTDIQETAECPYLYRSSKKVRAFIPPSEGEITPSKTEFSGQDLIKFTDKQTKQTNKKAFKKMMVKRIVNNPNRVKIK